MKLVKYSEIPNGGVFKFELGDEVNIRLDDTNYAILRANNILERAEQGANEYSAGLNDVDCKYYNNIKLGDYIMSQISS